MQLIVKLKDIIIDPAKPMDLAAMPADSAVALIRKAYGFLAANMNFEIQGDKVVITVDQTRMEDEKTAKDCFARGMKQAQSGRYNKAVDLFTRALQLVPEHTEIRRNLAMALMNSGRIAEAKDHLVDVLRLAPEDTWALVILGKIYTNNEPDLATAERFYRKALELDPKDCFALINYAAMKVESKDREGARGLFEQAIALDPKKPNPHYGLAMLLNEDGKPSEALIILERMFDTSEFDEVRMGELRKECQEFRLRLSAQVAEAEHDRHWTIILAAREDVEKMTGFPVDLIEDNSLDDATATSTPAWRSTGRHVVRYNTLGKAVSAHIVARELELIRMEHEARQAGTACLQTYAVNSPERAKAIEEHGRHGTANAQAFIAKVTDTLMPRMLRTPLDALVEKRIWDRLPGIRPSQTVGLYLHARQKRNPLDQPQVASALPSEVKNAHEIGAAAWAIYIDRLCGVRTAFAADYGRSPGFPLARELADGWWKGSLAFHPGDEYDLVRQCAQALGIEAWLDNQ